jgi:glycosyltransferase involved in cell wall biosynthesis
MRILQVSSAREIGGGETHVLQLVDGLRARGHHVAISGRIAGPLKPDFQFGFFRLRTLLKREQLDVVHAHVARDYPIVAAAARGISSLKVIFTRHLLYPVRRNPLYKRVDGWIAPTAQIMEKLKLLKPKRSAVIPNWVDLQKFAYRPHEFHHPRTIGLVGQISPHKGHDDAIEALRDLGGGFRLLIAGKGEPDYEASLKKKAAGLPIEFPGFVSLPQFFETIDILVAPSWEEPFGIVLLEAMASGIPVIATNKGGPAEFVRGLLVPARDPASLANAIRSVRPGQHVQEAREHVEKNFDVRKVIPLIEDFYRV